MKSLAHLQMSGTLADHPQRYGARLNEPQPKTPLGSAPSDLAPGLRKYWNEIRKMLNCMPGVAVYPDRYTVERLCRLVFKMRNNTLTVGEGNQMLTYLDKLGMTPQGRCRLEVAPKEKPKQDDWNFGKQVRAKGAPVRATGDDGKSSGLQMGPAGVQ